MFYFDQDALDVGYAPSQNPPSAPATKEKEKAKIKALPPFLRPRIFLEETSSQT